MYIQSSSLCGSADFWTLNFKVKTKTCLIWGSLSLRDLAVWHSLHHHQQDYCHLDTGGNKQVPIQPAWKENVCGFHMKLSLLTSHQSFQRSLTYDWCLTALKYSARLHPPSCCRVRYFPRINLILHSERWSAWHLMVPLNSCLACM